MAEAQPMFRRSEPIPMSVKITDIKPWQSAAKNDTGKSVSALGLFSAVLLAEIDDPRYRYEVRDGRRRLDSAVQAGIEQVPAMVAPPGVSEAELSAMGATANLLRSNSKLDEATDLKRLVDLGNDPAALARELGISVSTIHSRLRLFEVAPAFLEAVRSGKTSANTVAEVAKRTPEEQARLLETLTTNGELSMDDVKAVRFVAKQTAMDALPEHLFGVVEPEPAEVQFRNAVALACRQELSKERMIALVEEVMK